MKNLLSKWNKMSLVKQIIIGLVIGIILALTLPEQLSGITILGDLFVGALKAVAPVLVLFLVSSAYLSIKAGQKTNMKLLIALYLLGTFLAGTAAVIASFIFKLELVLPAGSEDMTPPGRNRRSIEHSRLQYSIQPCGRAAQCQLHRNPGMGDRTRHCAPTCFGRHENHTR